MPENTILDQFGNPAEKPESPTPFDSVASFKSRRESLEYPIRNLDPQNFDRAIRDADEGNIRDWMELCEEMEDRDGQIASKLATRKKMVAACPWSIKPYRDHDLIERRQAAKPDDVEVANFVRRVIEGMLNFDTHMMDMLDAISKGLSFMNIAWHPMGGGQWGIEDLIWVPQRKFRFIEQRNYPDEVGDARKEYVPRMLTDLDSDIGVPMKPFDWVIHAPRDRSIEPYRLGLMRILGWWFVFKHADLRYWMTFMEKNANPLTLGFYMPGASEATKTNLLTALRRLSNDQAAIMEYDPELPDKPYHVQYPLTREAAEAFARLAAYADDEINKVVMGVTLTTEDGDSRGSFALGTVHEKIGNVYLAQDAKELETTIRRDLIRPLVVYNFGEAAWNRLPFFKIHCEPPEDLEKKARQFGILAQQVGVVFSDAQLREEFGLDKPASPEDEVAFQPETPDAPPDGDDGGPPADGEPEETPDGDTAKRRTAQAITDERPTAPPQTEVLESIGVDLPSEVTRAVKGYGSTVDGMTLAAVGNVTKRTANFLKRQESPWKGGEEFAESYYGDWSRAWNQYWDEAMGALVVAITPFISQMYTHYKVEDLSAWPTPPSIAPSFGDVDQRVIDFLSRSDDLYVSKLIDNKSFNGKMKEFFIEEYAKNGGKLYGQKNAAIIDAFKKSAGKTAHKLTRYEVDRIIRTTVNRSREWSHIVQAKEAGAGQVIVRTQGDSRVCEFCAQFDGKTVGVDRSLEIINTALSMDDDTFSNFLDSRTDAHRAGVKAGVSIDDLIHTVGSPTYHSDCRCYTEVVV